MRPTLPFFPTAGPPDQPTCCIRCRAVQFVFRGKRAWGTGIRPRRRRAIIAPTMGHRRFALLGLAVAVLFAVDGAAAASKGAPRAAGHRRSSKTAGSRSSRQRDTEDDRDLQGWNGEARKGTRRPSGSKSSRGARGDGLGNSRVRSSSAGSSRSSSRLVSNSLVKRVASSYQSATQRGAHSSFYSPTTAVAVVL